MENKNYYEILGVSAKASPDEIVAAKNSLAKKYHPDVNMKKGIDTTEQMQAILEAYHTLSDPVKRKEYDRELRGNRSVMQTFDLHNMEEDSVSEDSGFIIYWKASGKLFEIISESDTLYKKKDMTERLSILASQALKPILVLRRAEIPEKYWHPDIMNWLFFASYKNRNYTTSYLLKLYDEHVKNDVSTVSKFKLQKKSSNYQRSVKKLMKY